MGVGCRLFLAAATLGAHLAASQPATASLHAPEPRDGMGPLRLALSPFSSAESTANRGCGGPANNDTGIKQPTVVYRPGQDVLVRWALSGFPRDDDRLDTGVRIALHYAPGDSFRENTLEGGVGGGDFLKLPVAPEGAGLGTYGSVVRIPPEKTCAYCTLQFLWAAREADAFFISCADVAITADGTFPAYGDPAIADQEGKAIASGKVTDAEGNVIHAGSGAGNANVAAAVCGVIFGMLALVGCGYFLRRYKKQGGSLKPPKFTFGKTSRSAADAPNKVLPLPDGWSTATDPSTGRRYYVNAATGQTSWTAPTATQADTVGQTESIETAQSLPSGWRMLSDPDSGQPYYVNEALGITQWEPPTSRV